MSSIPEDGVDMPDDGSPDRAGEMDDGDDEQLSLF